MALYEAGFQSAAAAAGAAYAELRGGANNAMRIREIGVTLTAATLSPVGLIRAAAQSGTPTAGALGQLCDGQSTTPAVTAAPTIAWTTAPTVTANTYLRQLILPAVIGAGFVWAWSERDPLIVAKAGSLLLWNYSATLAGILAVYLKWEE
jgi:hypothetical protein